MNAAAFCIKANHNFNLNAQSRFSNVNFGDNDAIANLDGGNGQVQNEKLGVHPHEEIPRQSVRIPNSSIML